MTGYDVVIVGAGSAGAVLAARLSEDPARRVLLLESGPVALDLGRLSAPRLVYIRDEIPIAVNVAHRGGKVLWRHKNRDSPQHGRGKR